MCFRCNKGSRTLAFEGIPRCPVSTYDSALEDTGAYILFFSTFHQVGCSRVLDLEIDYSTLPNQILAI